MEVLSARLRRETRALHAAAERAGIMRRLLRGEVGRAGYAALLRSLYALYDALETALDVRRAHPALAPLDFPPLRRRERIAEDLAYLGVAHPGGAGGAGRPLPRAAMTYVARLREIERAEPARLAAHAYVRYLGDLSGGRALRGVVAESLALPEGPGTAFYDFPGVDVGSAKREFRRALDGIGADAAVADAIVDEARWGFWGHVALFEELDADTGGRGSRERRAERSTP